MRPPEFTGGNLIDDLSTATDEQRASMRPPEFTGGNGPDVTFSYGVTNASMRPPEFTGGNMALPWSSTARPAACFNEAAGIHRRKR